jgi:hypothetical protein
MDEIVEMLERVTEALEFLAEAEDDLLVMVPTKGLTSANWPTVRQVIAEAKETIASAAVLQ